MNILKEKREEILDALVDQLSSDNLTGKSAFRRHISDILVFSRRDSFGEITLPAFQLQEDYGGMNPKEIAEMIRDCVMLPEHVTAQVVGGYVNYSIDPVYLTQQTLSTVLRQQQQYGFTPCVDEKPVIVEFSSPNYGKELHIGHIRSTIVGDAIARLLYASGNLVIRLNYPGDVGGHMGKVLAAIKKWNNGELPSHPPDALHVMAALYVRFEKEADESLQQEAISLNLAIENKEPETTALWEIVCQLSREAHAQIYAQMDISFDYIQPASSKIERGKQLVQKALEERIATVHEESGSISVLYDEGHYLKILGARGAGVYATLDLGAAVSRSEEYDFKRMIYVVGFEQLDYFKKLFAALKKLGCAGADHCEHLATGHLVLEEGKMSSREGNVILLEQVLVAVIEHARQVIVQKGIVEHQSSLDELARTIGIGALKYQILLTEPGSQIQYNEEKALTLTGKSAPFAQYAYARATRILERAECPSPEYNPTLLELAYERILIKRIAELPLAVKNAAEALKPNLFAEYIYGLACAFNAFYKNVPVLNEPNTEKRNSRIVLVQTFRQTMYNALHILGIEAPERM